MPLDADLRAHTWGLVEVRAIELEPRPGAGPSRRWAIRGRRALAGIAALVAIAAIAVVLARRRAPMVEAAVAERRPVVQTVVASGRVVPAARLELGALAVGRVIEVAAREGDAVRAGQLLARIDDSEAQAELARAQAQAEQARARLAEVRGPGARTRHAGLESAEASLALAREDLARSETLARSGAVSAQDLSRARTQVELAESERDAARSTLAASGTGARQAGADLAAAEAQIAAMRTRIEQLRIVAPADGVVIDDDVEPGDVVSAGQVLFELATGGPLEIRIDPDESTIASLAVGQPALVSAEAFPEQRLAARVREIAPAVDEARRTIEVRLAIVDPAAALRADMTVSVDVEVARRTDALVLPAGAVRDVGSAAPWVLAIDDGIATRRAVRLGAIGEDAIEILSGVREGERVVPASATDVEAGDRVRAR